MLYPRVLLATAILNQSLPLRLLPYLAAPAIIGAAIAAFGAFRSSQRSPHLAVRNPLQLLNALQMAVTFQVVLFLVHLAGGFWGAAGTLGSAAILGLTDVDALTLSMARGTAAPALAAKAIAVGVFANTAMKLGLTFVFGHWRFRLIAGGALTLMLITLGVMLLVR
jgi:uncharacterized membrane protein (DUF4010 family)